MIIILAKCGKESIFWQDNALFAKKAKNKSTLKKIKLRVPKGDQGPDHVQVFWKHKCFGNISQLETRPLNG